jgi:hypothetical protein
MRVLKFKINTKRTKVRSNVKNVPKNLLKKMFNMKEYESEFKDYTKAKKLIFKFVLDERNKTIKSIDQYSQYWHGIFKTEKLEFKEEFSSKNENIYGSKTSTWYGIGGMYATVLYQYIITVSSAKGGMRITPSVYIAYPHKADEEPKFKLCDSFDIVMDCVYSKEEALSFTTSLDDKIIKQIMSKSNMKKALNILSKGPKKNKKSFSRRVQNLDEFFLFDEKYDLVKLANNLNEIIYELLKEDQSTSFVIKMYFKKFIVQFYQLYAIHNKITFAVSLLKVLEILKLSGNKIIEDIEYPVEPTEMINKH